MEIAKMQEQTSVAVMSSRQAKKFQLSSELAKLKVERLEELRQEGPAQRKAGAAGAEERHQIQEQRGAVKRIKLSSELAQLKAERVEEQRSAADKVQLSLKMAKMQAKKFQLR